MSNVLIFSQQRHSLKRRICHSQSDKGQSIVTHIEKRHLITKFNGSVWIALCQNVIWTSRWSDSTRVMDVYCWAKWLKVQNNSYFTLSKSANASFSTKWVLCLYFPHVYMESLATYDGQKHVSILKAKKSQTRIWPIYIDIVSAWPTGTVMKYT